MPFRRHQLLDSRADGRVEIRAQGIALPSDCRTASCRSKKLGAPWGRCSYSQTGTSSASSGVEGAAVFMGGPLFGTCGCYTREGVASTKKERAVGIVRRRARRLAKIGGTFLTR